MHLDLFSSKTGILNHSSHSLAFTQSHSVFFSLGKTISGQTGRIFFLFLLLPFYLFSTLLIFPLLTSSFPCLHFSFFSPPLPSVFHSAFLFLLTSLISLPFHSSSFPLLPCSPVSSLCFHFPAKNSLRCSKQ